MPDGALLTQDDPLSLVLGISELQSNILKWNLPPLHERYLEACSQLGCGKSCYIKYTYIFFYVWLELFLKYNFFVI